MDTNILAINNAFPPTLITFGTSKVIHFAVRENPPRSNPNNILFVIEKLFKAFSTDVSKIDAISVVNGPGSFTGTRVSVVEAKIMAYTLSIPLVPINSLELIGIIIKNGTVLLPAGRNEFFAAEFRNGKMNSEIECVAPGKIQSKKIYTPQPVKEEIFEHKEITLVKVHAEEILKMSEEKLKSGETCTMPLSLNPIYLRSTNILFKKRNK